MVLFYGENVCPPKLVLVGLPPVYRVRGEYYKLKPMSQGSTSRPRHTFLQYPYGVRRRAGYAWGVVPVERSLPPLLFLEIELR